MAADLMQHVEDGVAAAMLRDALYRRAGVGLQTISSFGAQRATE